MDQYDETSKTWNKLAELYAEKFMELTLYNDSYDFLCELISENNPDILEIGCGPGNITKYLLKKRPDFRVLGIDNAANMIRLAMENNPLASFQVMDGRTISSLSTRFDVVVCGFCLPYLSKKDVSKLIVDISPLLQAEGILYISYVEGDYTKSGYQTGSSGDKVYFYYYSLAYFKNELFQNDFIILHHLEVPYPKSDGSSENHVVLIAKKKAAKTREKR